MFGNGDGYPLVEKDAVNQNICFMTHTAGAQARIANLSGLLLVTLDMASIIILPQSRSREGPGYRDRCTLSLGISRRQLHPVSRFTSVTEQTHLVIGYYNPVPLDTGQDPLVLTRSLDRGRELPHS